MDKLTAEERELLKALRIVMRDAQKQGSYHQKQVGAPPLGGWSKEKHEQYHDAHQKKAHEAYEWCFVRSMQIDPD